MGLLSRKRLWWYTVCSVIWLPSNSLQTCLRVIVPDSRLLTRDLHTNCMTNCRPNNLLNDFQFALISRSIHHDPAWRRQPGDREPLAPTSAHHRLRIFGTYIDMQRVLFGMYVSDFVEDLVRHWIDGLHIWFDVDSRTSSTLGLTCARFDVLRVGRCAGERLHQIGELLQCGLSDGIGILALWQCPANGSRW